MAEPKFLTEVPSSLKQLARLVVRGFYTIEDALIIDMLVRNPCMKEDDLCELLLFDKKQMRARIATLRSDKFIQVRLKMETGPDGKAQKVNYYFINYKTFVNVVKYKLDLMRKRMETEERDATSRASFKCTKCTKTFTDLEADQLYDFDTQEFRCTFCGSLVEEDSLALPKVDSRLMLAKFNEQLQPLYDLLRDVENVTLAPELLEPEPVDIDTIRNSASSTVKSDSVAWSGDATRNHGFAAEETRINILINGEEGQNDTAERKARPVWMTESTVVGDARSKKNSDGMRSDGPSCSSSNTQKASGSGTQSGPQNTSANNRARKENEDIMSVLLQHEKQATDQKSEALTKSIKPHVPNYTSSESSDDEQDIDNMKIPKVNDSYDVSDSDEEDSDMPVVRVQGRPYALNYINDELIAQMTPQEKEQYIHVYQHHFSHIYD